MCVSIAQPLIADCRSLLPVDVQADVVILDPPCTSTGVFGKLPSAKWRLTPNSIQKMADIQWKIINNAAEKVKPGGNLTYSTCTITTEENEVIIKRFLEKHTNFQLTVIEPNFGVPGLLGLEKCRRLYPHIHRSNGFFIAKLRKSDTTVYV